MNILPKKRWHVRTKENIARVRRDEAQAAEEERVKRERAEKAEAEARINLLRHQARSKYDGREESVKADKDASTSQLEHVNFFAELEQGKIDYSKPNKEHEQEKKEDKEKYEKQIGYLTYLGQDTNEAIGKTCWYEELPFRLKDKEKNVEIHAGKKALNDPIKDIRKYLHIMGANAVQETSKTNLEPLKRKREASEDSNSDHRYSKSSKKHKHKSKKSKKHKKEKRRSMEKVEICYEQPTKSLEKLRAERLLREQSEKLKAEALLAKLRGDPVPVVKAEEPKPVIKQKYNSQFFPEIARQNADRTPRTEFH